MRLKHKSPFLRVMKFIELISQGIGKMMEVNGKKKYQGRWPLPDKNALT
jgi:hypothetical protein